MDGNLNPYECFYCYPLVAIEDTASFDFVNPVGSGPHSEKGVGRPGRWKERGGKEPRERLSHTVYIAKHSLPQWYSPRRRQFWWFCQLHHTFPIKVQLKLKKGKTKESASRSSDHQTTERQSFDSVEQLLVLFTRSQWRSRLIQPCNSRYSFVHDVTLAGKFTALEAPLKKVVLVQSTDRVTCQTLHRSMSAFLVTTISPPSSCAKNKYTHTLASCTKVFD